MHLLHRGAVALFAAPIAAFALVLALASPPAAAAENITAEAARDAALAGEITLIDVRTPEEWRETGIPEGAHAASLSSPFFGAKMRELITANPDRPVALICAHGNRSAFVAKAIQRNGFENVLDVKEGVLGSDAGPGWIAKNLPVREPTKNELR